MNIEISEFIEELRPFRFPESSELLSDASKSSDFLILPCLNGETAFVLSWKGALDGLLLASFMAFKQGLRSLPAPLLHEWIGIPKECDSVPLQKGLLAWGRRMCMLSRSCSSEKYSLPLASFLIDSKVRKAAWLTVDDAAICRELANASFLGSLAPAVQNWTSAFEKLDERSSNILVLRYGLNGKRPRTLEEVGRAVGITRERVRQVQVRSLPKLERHFYRKKFELYFYQKGSRIMRNGSSEAAVWGFYQDIFSLSSCQLVESGCQLLGINPNEFYEIGDEEWGYPELFENASLHRLEDWRKGFTFEDLKEIQKILVENAKSRVNSTERMIMALEHLGESAHYSKINAVQKILFPKKKVTDRNAYANMTRSDEVVNVGRKGTYGLRKWGLEDLEEDLDELIISSLERLFAVVKSPIPFTNIVGKVRQSRPDADSTSIRIILGFQCENRAGDNWVPKTKGAGQEKKKKPPIVSRGLLRQQRRTR